MRQIKVVIGSSFGDEGKAVSYTHLDGFDELYAITFSSGLQFMNKLLQKFSFAEVIFGCEEVLGCLLYTSNKKPGNIF